MILIYPHNYKSTITKQIHEGEVNPRGIIVLSWEAFKFGFADDTDGRNMALHEMAHALMLENFIHNGESNFINTKLITSLKHEAILEIEKIKNPNIHSIFRKYASTNFQEFFAVATEMFFEQAQLLYDYNSKVYSLMSSILNQDPLKPYKN